MIDSHVHLWKPTQLSYPWLTDEPSINRNFLLEDLAEESVGRITEGIVFVQAGTEAKDFLNEAKWVNSLADRESSELGPKILGVVAGASLESGRSIRPHLEALSEMPIVKGVRRLIQGEPDDFFSSQPAFIEGLKCLPEFDLSFDICIYHHQLESVLKMVDACPDVSFILDHLGKPGVRNGLVEPWRSQIKELASFDNVVCKISGLVTEADHDSWTKEELSPYLEHVIDCFGQSRLLFGSDWPVINLAGSYPAWLDILESHFPMDEAYREDVFSRNAKRVYKL